LFIYFSIKCPYFMPLSGVQADAAAYATSVVAEAIAENGIEGVQY
jgi:hypothetical protein